MRGSLDKEILTEISSKIPSLKYLQEIVPRFAPDLISIRFSPESAIPVAAVCLQDTLSALEEANYALHESIACRIWYLEKCDPANKGMALFLQKFYLDDVTLRLYSAGEHLAEAIISLLDVKDEELGHYKRRKISRQAVLGEYLKNELPSNPITHVVMKLAKSGEWLKTMDYRSNWVHSQPPLLKDFGIVYRREKRWKRSDSGKTIKLGIGGGDIPNQSVDDLDQFIRPAMFLFTETFIEIVKYYINLLEKNSISFASNGRLIVSMSKHGKPT